MNAIKNLITKTLSILTESDAESRAAGDRVVREITFIR